MYRATSTDIHFRTEIDSDTVMILVAFALFSVWCVYATGAPLGANSNADLAAPIYEWSDLLGTYATYPVPPTNYTLGETEVGLYSMPVSDTTIGSHPLPGCTTFTAHWHPYADELSMVVKGGEESSALQSHHARSVPVHTVLHRVHVCSARQFCAVNNQNYVFRLDQ